MKISDLKNYEVVAGGNTGIPTTKKPVKKG